MREIQYEVETENGEKESRGKFHVFDNQSLGTVLEKFFSVDFVFWVSSINNVHRFGLLRMNKPIVFVNVWEE